MPYDIIIGRDESDKKRFGSEGLIYLGKQYVKMGQTTSMTNRILMDVARSHVVLVAGKRGSGKSYTLGVIAEELANLPKEVAQNLSCLIYDTMGIFWTMAYRNEKEMSLLKDWQMESKSLPIRIFVPYGFAAQYEERGIPVSKSFAIKASELNVDDWCLTFNLNYIDPVAIVIERNITELKETEEDYNIDDIIKKIKDDKEADSVSKNAAKSLFEGARTWGLFAIKGKEGISSRDVVEEGKTTVIDLSCYSSIGTFNVRALVIGLLSKKIFNERMIARKTEEVEAVQHGIDYLYYKSKREMPLVWILIDEAHEFLPKEGKTAATDALIQLLREGRQPGISMALATQQPGGLSRDVMTQSDIVLSHRLTAKPDVDALNLIMQTYLSESILTYMNNLPHLKGSAIILDDNSERIHPMRVRARMTWHGGEAPTAVKIIKRV
ncbi:hypothetical protein COS75_03355 [Candidatus Pacearchaeota archaeon CG06_land_8_20_14_3_00_35_12]|nr:MAG: hypothetical protein COS75_03355 [Candidatus Pacearchaeota archaeon CG06_land_8_20_14_3_00_35_12]